jgi:cytoskeletal protein CcmA (bactofilin family)
VEDALFILSGDIEISGQVGGDAYLFAGALELTGTIEGDLYVFSGDGDLKPGSVVEGRVMAYSGNVVLDGVVQDDVEIQSGSLRIGGTIQGNLEAAAGEIHLTSSAVIEGDVDYISGARLQLDEGATILGDTDFTLREVDLDGIDIDVSVSGDHDRGGFGLIGWLICLLMALVFGGFLLWAGGPLAVRASDTAYKKPAFQLGLGFAILVVVPTAALAACFLILPIPLSAAAMMFLVLTWFAGEVVAATALGRWIVERIGNADTSPFLLMAVGTLALALVRVIPVLGFFVTAAAGYDTPI